MSGTPPLLQWLLLLDHQLQLLPLPAGTDHPNLLSAWARIVTTCDLVSTTLVRAQLQTKLVNLEAPLSGSEDPSPGGPCAGTCGMTYGNNIDGRPLSTLGSDTSSPLPSVWGPGPVQNYQAVEKREQTTSKHLLLFLQTKLGYELIVRAVSDSVQVSRIPLDSLLTNVLHSENLGTRSCGSAISRINSGDGFMFSPALFNL
ncbi:hypothetical protein DFH07DRAFT_776582 [Mycena maculata]|uniref:Uncharacterized protein n=1 Tax=Mycena maculata TaxID=230809 RepID=A0AAD7N518_9AGAR|nr:hypothetical protein DFH07DRAFT_776582 [Mycena maculata]